MSPAQQVLRGVPFLRCPADWVSVLHVARQLKAGPMDEEPEAWLLYGGAGQLVELLVQVRPGGHTSVSGQGASRAAGQGGSRAD